MKRFPSSIAVSVALHLALAIVVVVYGGRAFEVRHQPALLSVCLTGSGSAGPSQDAPWRAGYGTLQHASAALHKHTLPAGLPKPVPAPVTEKATIVRQAPAVIEPVIKPIPVVMPAPDAEPVPVPVMQAAQPVYASYKPAATCAVPGGGEGIEDTESGGGVGGNSGVNTGPGSGDGNGPGAGSGVGGEGGVARFGECGGPTIIRMTRPEYPARARMLEVEGRVVLKLSLDSGGAVRDVTVVEPAGYGFDEAAVDAAMRSRFGPAEKDGRPVGCQALLPVRFALGR